MVINSFRPFVRMTLGVWLRFLPIIAYVGAISALDLQYHFEDFNFPVTMVVTLGTIIGLLLAFRTNSSYARWWEARILWGAIVNDSRTWVRQLFEFKKESQGNPETDLVLRRMAYRQIGWCYALSRDLRDQDPLTELETFVDESETESYRASKNVSNDILLKQGRELRQLFESDQLALYTFVELEKTLTRLTDSMGGCERIKNTPFPTSYSRMVDGMIYLFVIFLPFGLVKVPAIGLISTSLSFSFALLLIEQVAIYLQDPFSGRPSDTPMLSLSRTIEINIKQMLGETELPDKLAPVDGVLH